MQDAIDNAGVTGQVKNNILKPQTKRILMNILPGLQAGLVAEIIKCFTILTPV